MATFLMQAFNKLKLFTLFWIRIVFVKNHHKLSFYKKIKANFGGGYLADQYVLYDFDHNDKNEYLSEFDWYRSRFINDPYNNMLNNKVICTDVLKQFIKVPEIFFVKTKNKMVSYENRSSSYDEVIIKLKKEKTLYMKPINAGKGKNVRKFDYNDEVFKIDEKVVLEQDILKLIEDQKGWFISQTVHQADYLNKIYDKTTNTLRMIALKNYDTNIFELFFAVQRIGTKQTIPVDNGSRGGLVCNVNIETGELSEAKSLHSLTVHAVHPDSKSQLKGTKIPGWQAIKNDIVELSNEFPYLNFIAWDVLVTEQGPVIIEANTSSGVNIIQIWGGQRQKGLGDFYRKHNVIK